MRNRLYLIWSLTISFIVKNNKINENAQIKNFGAYRGWEDGTFAKSCEEYRYPPRFYNYEGSDVKFFYTII